LSSRSRPIWIPNHRDRGGISAPGFGRNSRRNMKTETVGHRQKHRRFNNSDPVFAQRARDRGRGPGPATSSAYSQPRHFMRSGGHAVGNPAGWFFNRHSQFCARDIAPGVALSDPMKAETSSPARLASLAEGRRDRNCFKASDRRANGIVGVVGALQLDVLKSRLVAEYKSGSGTRSFSPL